MTPKPNKSSNLLLALVCVFLLSDLFNCKRSNATKGSTSDSESQKQTFDDTKEFKAKTGRIKNGDTFTVFVDGGEEITIQLAEIDAPEQGQPYSKEAKELLFTMTDHEQVRIIPRGRDKFGRLLGTVFLFYGNTNINESMVRKGAAWHYKEFSADTTLARLEGEARDRGLGLWEDPNPIPPWEYRRLRRSKP